jgi:hypothetical protein
MKTIESGPDLGIAEPSLLQHFRDSLGPESVVFLDSSSRGSFAHLTLSGCKDILGKILENTSYMGIFDELPDEEEPIPRTLSEPKPIEEEHTFPAIQSIEYCTPLTKTWFTNEPFQSYREVEDPSCDFVYDFYDELFADFGNTWNYQRVGRPKAQEEPETLIPCSGEQAEHFRLISNLSAIMSREWLDEAEASTDVIKFPTKMRHTRCELMGNKHDVGYEPSLGVNIISSSLAKSLAVASSLSRSSKLLIIPLGETLGCQGVLRVCPIKFIEHELYLDFHLFDLPCHHTHSIIIGRPIMKILEQSPRKPELELQIGDDFLPVSYLRTQNSPAEAKPKPDLQEEVMAASLGELAQPNFEEEIPFFMEEDEAPVPFKLYPTEKPERPPIELKPLPPGLKYAFLHGNRETPMIISDKLTKVETQQLITVLEIHRSVLGYSLQDLKGISPTFCTHQIPIELDATPSREP